MNMLTIVVSCNSTNKSCQLQYCIQKLSIAIMHTKDVIYNCYIQKLSFAIVAYKSCHLQLLHTKAIAALMQFCDVYKVDKIYVNNEDCCLDKSLFK